jgi:hypothetical protein
MLAKAGPCPKSTMRELARPKASLGGMDGSSRSTRSSHVSTERHEGTSGRWRGVFREEDLALYDAKVEAGLPPACARWVAHGRRSSADPRPPAAD